MAMDVLEGIGMCHLLHFIPSVPLSPAYPVDRDRETNKPWSLPSRSSESRVGASTALQGPTLADQANPNPMGLSVCCPSHVSGVLMVSCYVDGSIEMLDV